MMSNVTVNVSFQDSLLRDIDRIARSEARSRSEIIREAARMYILRKKRWAGLFALRQEITREKSLTVEDVATQIKAYRKNKASRK